MRLPSAVVERRALGVAFAIVGGALVGCREGASDSRDASAEGAPSVTTTPSTPNASSTSSALAPPSHAIDDAASPPPCRVMTAENGPSPTADATTWLDVPAKGSFTVKILESGRELRFEGPGRVRPCADDVTLVADGAAIGLPGAGEAPGSEQWIATACGVVRWASGVHRMTGAGDGCKLQSSLGTAHLFVADDVVVEDAPLDGGAAPSAEAGASPAGAWRRIDAKRALRLRSKRPLDDVAAAKTALGACERAAQAVQALSAQMSAGDASAPIGDLASGSVAARGVARAACALAAVRVSLAGSPPEEQKRLDAASARWRR
ncbi:MAG: hypothetical protein KF819_04570 [Labilithrix sp.]|nr:hypothetical protein [Labilithrix sp.]